MSEKTYVVRVPGCGDELTPREREIVAAVGRGLSNKQIARELRLSLNTVKFHLSNIYRKLRLKNRLQLYCWSVDWTLSAKYVERSNPSDGAREGRWR